MSNDIDDFVDNLQNQIYEETRITYGDIAFQRWCKPLYMGDMDNPDGHGRIKGTCGDTMQVYLKFESDKVNAVSFKTDGCGSSTICGSFAAELALGLSPDEILNISGESVLEKAGDLPEEDRHCAFLSADALHEALSDYMIKQKRN